MKINFLIDNKTENTSCTAEWGLAVLIETGNKKILMDQGSSPMLIANAAGMGIDLSEVDYATVSHGHFDHSGGTEAFLEINDKAKVYVHKDAFVPTVDLSDGMETGLPWGEDFMKKYSERIIKTEGTFRIEDGAWLVGDVPRAEGFEPTGIFHYRVGDEFFPDPMKHEQTLVIEENGKLNIFSGCSHQGIVPILKYIEKEFPGMKINALVAGMHLFSASREQRLKVIKEIEKMGIEHIFPVHCTGMNAIIDFKIMLGDKVEIASAGDTYEV